jgi:hypothetical protein
MMGSMSPYQGEKTYRKATGNRDQSLKPKISMLEVSFIICTSPWLYLGD